MIPTSPVPRECSNWTLRTRQLEFGTLPAIMGIVNVTPDSFSDGGLYLSAQQAIDRALRLEDEGANLLDIGGESTRPYSQVVARDEELRRVVPVLEGLRGRLSIPLSIDTSKASVARAALDLGVEVINDVTGFEGDPEMLALAVDSGAGVCAMHMQGTPQSMQDAPAYRDVVEEIYDYLSHRRTILLQAGVDRERICLDPGIGFGKTHQHNIELVSCCERFLPLGQPILVGHSRKGFIAHLIGNKERDRTAGSVGVGLVLAHKGAHVLRVHDVAATADALRCFAACGGLG